MSAELLNLKLCYHEGAAGGGIIDQSGYIQVEEDGKNSKGIHFHHSETLTPQEATTHLRSIEFIDSHETVLAIVGCGKDWRGAPGWAARTDAMAEPEEDSSLELLGIEFGALIPEDSTDLET